MPIQISVTSPANSGQSLSTGPRAGAVPPAPTGGGNVQIRESVPPPQSRASVDPARLKEAVDTINRKLQDSSQGLRFSVDNDSGRVVVRVVDTATDQTIRQIPSEVAIEISQSLEKLQGLLVRQQA